MRAKLVFTRAVVAAFVGFCPGGCASTRTDVPLDEQYRRELILQQLIEQGVLALGSRSPAGVERAFGVFSVAGQLAPDDPRVVDGLGAVAYRRGQRDYAVLLFQKAIQLDSSYSRPYAHLALIAEDDGDKEAARELLEMSRRLNPMSYRARHNLALLVDGLEESSSGVRSPSASGDGWEVDGGSPQSRSRFVCDELVRAIATTPAKDWKQAVAAYESRCRERNREAGAENRSKQPDKAWQTR